MGVRGRAAQTEIKCAKHYLKQGRLIYHNKWTPQKLSECRSGITAPHSCGLAVI